jgi:two-component system sensor histidine kinase KdpD
LSVIESAGSSLADGQTVITSEDQRALARTIVQESRRMTRLVDNLLDIVRVETRSLAVKKAWQPLEETLGAALVRLQELLRGRPVHTALPPDLPLVPADELLLEQVFLNLLENAAHYTPPGTPIEISARAEAGGVLIEVADRGPGIPLGAEEAVFARFYRAPGSTPPAEEGRGSGLGLAICRGILQAHGGRIWVEQRPGGGAAFRLWLPLDGPPIPAKLQPE